ncbi:uncharacterized protein PHACADRAFT_33234 [Phanerochaete carnosa HHB-10118-sp]|uniref:BTB domain-containing protein n=1 Tax=Phanerochaete carnosa (strain HHB-10118-sp) TaxID=650164 RepID=K5VSB1_PHACS|nr:uncharacterized protein PHACADRAFT_33234 [Phanerochaete carnosa HHB-10118-sp]EKM49665.1 hypothetical protein PHACADRAFT_33234 [Phanerochaete carnosa HHB-10118-sp]
MNNYQAMLSILDGKCQERSLSGRDVPNTLWDVMLACWRFEPSRRADALTVQRQLEGVDLSGYVEPLPPSNPGVSTSTDSLPSSESAPTPLDAAVFNKSLPPPPTEDSAASTAGEPPLSPLLVLTVSNLPMPGRSSTWRHPSGDGVIQVNSKDADYTPPSTPEEIDVAANGSCNKELSQEYWRLEPSKSADALTTQSQLEAGDPSSPPAPDTDISADSSPSSELTPTPPGTKGFSKELPPLPAANSATSTADRLQVSSTPSTSRRISISHMPDHSLTWPPLTPNDSTVGLSTPPMTYIFHVPDYIPARPSSSVPQGHSPLLVDAAVARSTETWSQDLRGLFEHAKDYYPNVVWRIADGSIAKVWGHSAIVWARVPLALQERYFPWILPSTPTASPVRINITGNKGDAFERLFHNKYRGITHIEGDLRDMLRQDLLSMWRCHLHSDIRIAIVATGFPDSSEKQTDTVMLPAHRFMLASRSSYFHEQLRKIERVSGEFTLNLPSPPFTSLSIYFILGWIYTGTLAFSDQQWDLAIAFDIMRCAMYLHIDALYDEIQARVVMDMMHGFFYPFLLFSEYDSITGNAWGAVGCKCIPCMQRAPRILDFSLEDDVKNSYLERGARRALTAYFGEGWCTTEFVHLSPETRLSILEELTKHMTPLNVFPLLYSFHAGIKKIEGVEEPWADVSRELLLTAASKISQVLCDQSAECFQQEKWLDLMDAYGEDVERDKKLGQITSAIRRGLNDSNASKLYQSMLSHPGATPYVRTQVEQTAEGILGWVCSLLKSSGKRLNALRAGVDTSDEELFHLLNQSFAVKNNKARRRFGRSKVSREDAKIP